MKPNHSYFLQAASCKLQACFSNLQTGFSLIEMIIYIALLVLLVVSLLTGIHLMLNAYRYGLNRAALADAGQLAVERLVREIRSGTSINTGASAFNATTSALSLQNIDAWGNATTTVFSVSSSALRITQGAGSSTALLPPTVGVQEFMLYQITASSSQAIRIVLQLDMNTTTNTTTATFYDTAVLRGSY